MPIPPSEPDFTESLSQYHIRNLKQSAYGVGHARPPARGLLLLTGALLAVTFWLADAWWLHQTQPAFTWSSALYAQVPLHDLLLRVLVSLLLLLAGVLGIYAFAARRLNRALLRSSKWFSTTMRSIGAAVIATDRHGCVTLMNTAAQEYTGWPLERAVGKPLDQVCTLAVQAEGKLQPVALSTHIKEGRNWKLPNWCVLQAASGSTPPVAGTLSPIVDSSQEVVGFVLVLQDLSWYRAAEESQIRLATAITQSADGVLITDSAGLVVHANPAMEVLCGVPAKALVGQPAATLRSQVEPPELITAILDVLTRERRWRGHVTLRRKDGVRQLECSVGAVLDERGAVGSYLISCRDISREMQLQQQLVRSQKMEAMGLLAGGVAHDFNNFLAIIMGYADLLLRDLPEDGEPRRHVEEIRGAATRAAALGRQLLTFSRRDQFEPKPLRLEELINGTVKLTARVLHERITIHTELQPDVAPILADRGQMEQVLVNLILNARDAMPQGGRIVIRTAQVPARDCPTDIAEKARAATYAVLTVVDTGTGMDITTLTRIFEPYFTTKGPDRGTGLGLSTVYAIVDRHGGGIRVDSSRGHGTVFNLYLPQTGSTSPVGASTVVVKPPPNSQETILVADDDALIRTVIDKQLQAAGYTVLLARDGAEALTICREYPGTIHLLLTDLVMPNLDGMALARVAKALRPTLHTAFMTGYAEARDASLPAQPDYVLLRKPFSPDNLQRYVRDRLQPGRLTT